jgi:RecB family endonuclease NucS
MMNQQFNILKPTGYVMIHQQSTGYQMHQQSNY